MLSYVPVFYFIVSMTQFYPIVITQLINNEVLASNIKSGNLSQLVCPETQILLVIAYAIRYASAISYFGFRQEEILTEVLKSVQIMSWVFLFLRLISKKYNLYHLDKNSKSTIKLISIPHLLILSSSVFLGQK